MNKQGKVKLISLCKSVSWWPGLFFSLPVSQRGAKHLFPLPTLSSLWRIFYEDIITDLASELCEIWIANVKLKRICTD